MTHDGEASAQYHLAHVFPKAHEWATYLCARTALRVCVRGRRMHRDLRGVRGPRGRLTAFERRLVPDESFFQTVAMHSPFAVCAASSLMSGGVVVVFLWVLWR